MNRSPDAGWAWVVITTAFLFWPTVFALTVGAQAVCQQRLEGKLLKAQAVELCRATINPKHPELTAMISNIRNGFSADRKAP